MATATMKRYRVAVRIPILYEVEVDAMSAAEAESLARCEVDSGAMDSGEGTLDGVAVVVDSEKV